MSKCIKIAVFTLAAFVFGFIVCGESSATDIPTSKQYEKYLEEKGDAESLKMKEQFSKLPLKKKQKLLKYFFGPEVMKTIYSQDTSSDGKKVLYNGDVVIENETIVTEKDVEEDSPSQTTRSFLSTFLFGNVFAAPKIKEYTASHVKKLSVARTWLKFNTSIKYRVNNGKVVKIFSGSATTTKCLWLATVEKTSFQKYITKTNNMAHGEAIWETSIPILKNKIFDICPLTINCYHLVHGYNNGKITHSYWEQ